MWATEALRSGPRNWGKSCSVVVRKSTFDPARPCKTDCSGDFISASGFGVKRNTKVGINSPLVFGPYASSSQDTSGCPQTGGLPVNSDGAVIWANDTFTRTYIVKPNSDRTFDVTELFDGTFVTLNSSTPVGTTSNCSTLLNAGITGQFYGDEAFRTAPNVNFNFKATCPPGCTGTQFFSTFFNTAVPGGYAWQFHYTTPSNGSWDNTDHGNSGDLHN